MLTERDEPGFVVDLDLFSGPLDLLLSLIRRDELDIFDIPIARITDQYLAALEELRERRVEVSGEFMVLAATLMQIKSRMLLPRPQVEGGSAEAEDDPRRELVELLLEYQTYKEAAELLEELAAVQQRRFPAPGEELVEVTTPIVQATVTALVQAYERALAATVEPEPPPMREATWEVREQSELLLTRLAFGPARFDQLFGPRPTRMEVVVTFMALLELVRHGRIRAEQDEPFGDILLALTEVVAEHG